MGGQGSVELLLERDQVLYLQIYWQRTHGGKDSIGQQGLASVIKLACVRACMRMSGYALCVCAYNEPLLSHWSPCYANVRVFVFGCGVWAHEYDS